jgi:hypothetical protein
MQKTEQDAVKRSSMQGTKEHRFHGKAKFKRALCVFIRNVVENIEFARVQYLTLTNKCEKHPDARTIGTFALRTIWLDCSYRALQGLRCEGSQ